MTALKSRLCIQAQAPLGSMPVVKFARAFEGLGHSLDLYFGTARGSFGSYDVHLVDRTSIESEGFRKVSPGYVRGNDEDLTLAVMGALVDSRRSGSQLSALEVIARNTAAGYQIFQRARY